MTLSPAYRDKMKEALAVALPIIAGQLGQVLMGFFDTVQLYDMGPKYIAASGFANGLYWMIALLGMGVLFAVSPLVSEAFGEQKAYKSIGVLMASIVLSFVLTIIFMIVIWQVTDHIELLRQKPSVNILGAKFLRIVNFSTLFMFLFMAGKQFLDGMERTSVGMYITFGGLLLNIFLNQVLIYGIPGVPAMGIEGAAIATTTARVAMSIAILIFIWQDKRVKELRKEFAQYAEKSLAYIKPILVIGVPASLQIFFEIAAFNVGLFISGLISENTQAAHVIAINLASITFMVATGISSAGTIMIGYSFGAKDREGIRVSGNTVFMLTIAAEIFFALVFITCHALLPKIYTADVEVLSIASSMLILVAIFQISDGLQAVAAGALRGMQDVIFSAVIAFISYGFIMIPACYLLTFYCGLGFRGVWLGFIIGLTVAAVLQLIRFRLRLRTLKM